jgi:phospholipid transport system transporter-binding protein
MSAAQLKKIDDKRLALSGELSMDTVPYLLSHNPCSGTSGELSIDLQAVERADSAGVALLIEWQRVARRRQQVLHFQHIPSQMRAIARLCGVDKLLSLD